MTIPSTQEIFFNSEKGPQKNNVDYFIVKFDPYRYGKNTLPICIGRGNNVFPPNAR